MKLSELKGLICCHYAPEKNAPPYVAARKKSGASRRKKRLMKKQGKKLGWWWPERWWATKNQEFWLLGDGFGLCPSLVMKKRLREAVLCLLWLYTSLDWKGLIEKGERTALQKALIKEGFQVKPPQLACAVPCGTAKKSHNNRDFFQESYLWTVCFTIHSLNSCSEVSTTMSMLMCRIWPCSSTVACPRRATFGYFKKKHMKNKVKNYH